MGDLSPHFSRAEFQCSGCTPEKPCWRNCVDTVDAALLTVLERIRGYYGAPVRILSGFRCIERNAIVGGAINSQHLYGRAADIVVDGVPPDELYQFLDPWHTGGQGGYKTFTHIDTRRDRVRWSS